MENLSESQIKLVNLFNEGFHNTASFDADSGHADHRFRRMPSPGRSEATQTVFVYVSDHSFFVKDC